MMEYDHEKCKQERESNEQKIIAKLEAMERRLYRDNGVLSIQTRIDRLSQAHLTNQWLARAAIMAVIGHIVASIVGGL